jgi:hypothetical protein
MSSLVMAHLAPFINKVITPPVSAASLFAEQERTALGIDSLSAVNVLVDLSEHFKADLSAYVDTLEPPRTMADLLRIAALFMENGCVSDS